MKENLFALLLGLAAGGIIIGGLMLGGLR